MPFYAPEDYQVSITLPLHNVSTKVINDMRNETSVRKQYLAALSLPALHNFAIKFSMNV